MGTVITGQSTKQMKILGVIPSRYASSRLPGKPLQKIAGVTLIERVWRRASEARLLSELVVATDHPGIEEEVRRLGGRVVMTDSALATGSERVYAVAVGGARENMQSAHNAQEAPAQEIPWDIVVNIQGDMPFISGEVIDQAIGMFLESKNQFGVTTIALPIRSESDFRKQSVAKVVINEGGKALYFSRAPIPSMKIEYCGEQIYGFQHIGLYVYSPQALSLLAQSPISPLERSENLEQLRLLEAGVTFGVKIVEDSHQLLRLEVNTPEDLAQVEAAAALD